MPSSARDGHTHNHPNPNSETVGFRNVPSSGMMAPRPLIITCTYGRLLVHWVSTAIMSRLRIPDLGCHFGSSLDRSLEGENAKVPTLPTLVYTMCGRLRCSGERMPQNQCPSRNCSSWVPRARPPTAWGMLQRVLMLAMRKSPGNPAFTIVNQQVHLVAHAELSERRAHTITPTPTQRHSVSGRYPPQV